MQALQRRPHENSPSLFGPRSSGEQKESSFEEKTPWMDIAPCGAIMWDWMGWVSLGADRYKALDGANNC